MTINHSYKQTVDEAVDHNCNAQTSHSHPLPRACKGFTFNPLTYWNSFNRLKEMIDNMYYQRTTIHNCAGQVAIRCPQHSGIESTSINSFRAKYDEIKNLKRCNCYNRQEMSTQCVCFGNCNGHYSGSCHCEQVVDLSPYEHWCTAFQSAACGCKSRGAPNNGCTCYWYKIEPPGCHRTSHRDCSCMARGERCDCQSRCSCNQQQYCSCNQVSEFTG